MAKHEDYLLLRYSKSKKTLKILGKFRTKRQADKFIKENSFKQQGFILINKSNLRKI